MKKLPHVFLVFLLGIFATSMISPAGAVLPSGNGQTTAAKSVSVVFASDAAAISATVDTSALATAAAQATALTALNMLTQPRTTTAITKSDATDVTALCNKGFFVGGAGDVAVKGLDDSAATTLSSIPAGTYIPGNYKRIMSTNTTATLIVCLGGTG